MNSKIYYAGIDPGITGAIALINSNTMEISLIDTPSYEDGKRTRIDVAAAADIISTYQHDIIRVTIEKSQPMPPPQKGRAGHGSIASFSLGYSFGVWLGILATLRVPYQLVTPQAWKKELMAGQPKEKEAGRITALRLFPQAADQLKLKKYHNRGDALLMAHYGSTR